MKRCISFLLIAALLCPGAQGISGIADAADGIAEEAWPIDTGEVTDLTIFEESIPVINAEDIQIDVPAAILIEKETGTVIYEKNADEQLPPASVTKIMTILLIVETIEAGLLGLDDMVTTGAEAAGMGGSQIYLEEGEQMSVRDMLKSIVVSSANDACVAMAEHIAGTQSAFIARMNERAAELGMTNTVFLNCTGLPVNGQENLTTARDVAIMSRALLLHGMIREYTTIWMDTVRNGEFGLSNTNKLIYYYEGATGLKTGFTQSAMYCLSASAERDGVEYIAVVLHGETSDKRFESAKALLSYAFANYTLMDTQPDEVLKPIEVELGTVSYVQPVLARTDRILIRRTDAANITKSVEMEPKLTAPVESGQQVGTLIIYSGESVLAEVPIVTADSVGKITWGQIFGKFILLLCTGTL